MIKSQAPGKMILIGEYAVLEGAPALVSSLECYARVTITDNLSGEYIIASPSLGIPERSFVMSAKGHIRFDPVTPDYELARLHFFSVIFEETHNLLVESGIRIRPAKIVINTDDFYSTQLQAKYGFGSSAAMTVALIHALFCHVGLQSANMPDEIFRLAFIAHRRAQGNLGSGIDVAASTYGGVLKYQLDKLNDLQPLPSYPLVINDHLYILPVWAGHSTSTRKMVNGVDALKKSKPQVYDKIMEQLVNCSADACVSYREGKVTDFLDSVRTYNRLLLYLGTKSGMPIVSEQHRRLTNIVENEGGYYKPSGAGGGDIGVCFSNSSDVIARVKNRLNKDGFQPLEFAIARNGVRKM